MTLLQKVALIVKMTTEDGGTYEDSFLNLVCRLELPKTFSDDDPDIEEELDFENFCFTEVKDDEITFCAGGDWQNPLKITLGLDQFNEIVVTRYEKGYEDNYQIRFHDIIENVKE